ncbi:MAG TPA: ECF-type sigma factor [Phycisphaerae bacterium]
MTRILSAVPDQAGGVSERLLPLVYAELRRLAAARLAKLPPGQTLQPTALVHDAYLRLVGGGPVTWQGRGHFFGAAAIAMRDILVEQARRKGRIKRGGGRKRIELDEELSADDLREGAPGAPGALDVIALDTALQRLGAQDPRKREIVMLRYFAGMSIEETAEALGISPATVKREWNYAKAWLYDALRDKE